MPVKLIIGLGNPGADYQRTRHNAGFWFLDELANADFRLEKRFNALFTTTTLAGHEVKLLKPLTYMNRSGDAVQKCMHFYKLEVSQILVAHDELDLPVGMCKLKKNGGHAGHNGLRDIQAKIGTADYLRLRIGIDRPEHKNVSAYVLSAPNQAERQQIDDALIKSYHAMTTLLSKGVDEAMLTLHTK